MTNKRGFYTRFSLLLFCSIMMLIFLSITYNTHVFAHEVDWEQIKEDNENILKNDKEDVQANFEYSIALANLGLIEEAYDHFELIEEDISIYKFNRTIHPFIKDLNVSSKNILRLNYAAFSLSINSKYEESVPFFERIIELQPENIWIRNFLAVAYIELEEYDLAKKEVNTALEIKDNKYSHLVLGYIYYETGSYLKALIELGRSGDLAKRVIFDND